MSIVGARPQFIKASAVSRAAAACGVEERLVHTGQHFDDEMSGVFFRELGLVPPHLNLGINGGGHGQMTGRMLQGLEPVICAERPDAVLVYGDTNSTLAGALAAAKLAIPVVHLEAGMRSRRRSMPEEINRILTDHASTVLCCPTRTGVDNLRREGFDAVLNEGALVEGTERMDMTRPSVANVGDLMLDVLLRYRRAAAERSRVLERLDLASRGYCLLTIHRAENTETIDALTGILDAVDAVAADVPVVFVVHPRTARLLGAPPTSRWAGIRLVPPVSYLDFLQLQANARVILTDSGGVQKEALFLGVPCITLRDETEWPETTIGGWNRLAGSRPRGLAEVVSTAAWPRGASSAAFGMGDAARRTLRLLQSSLS
jgi:UDP-N-acetylglucosamine 2-epimerase